jgi:hypothetical protein
VSGWIWDENLRPFLEVISQLAGYAFDDLDWDAISWGVAEAEQNGDPHRFKWFDYNLGDVVLRIAESGPRVEVEAEEEIERCVEALISLMQNCTCELIGRN